MFLATIFLTACGTTIQPKYYLLTPAASTAAASAPGAQQLVISVGPVSLPEYLDRSQIVTRRGDAQLDLADDQRWAEPLEENFSRVLAENLQSLMGTASVMIFPAREHAPVDYRVTIAVLRFDTNDQGEALLIANWNIADDKHNALQDTQRSEYRLDISHNADYPERVAALSRTIDRLGKDIFDAITGLARSEN